MKKENLNAELRSARQEIKNRIARMRKELDALEDRTNDKTWDGNSSCHSNLGQDVASLGESIGWFRMTSACLRTY